MLEVEVEVKPFELETLLSVPEAMVLKPEWLPLILVSLLLVPGGWPPLPAKPPAVLERSLLNPDEDEGEVIATVTIVVWLGGK